MRAHICCYGIALLLMDSLQGLSHTVSGADGISAVQNSVWSTTLRLTSVDIPQPSALPNVPPIDLVTQRYRPRNNLRRQIQAYFYHQSSQSDNTEKFNHANLIHDYQPDVGSSPALQSTPVSRVLPTVIPNILRPDNSTLPIPLLANNVANKTTTGSTGAIAPATKDSIYHPDTAHLRLLHLLLIVCGAFLVTAVLLFVALHVLRRYKKKNAKVMNNRDSRKGFQPDLKLEHDGQDSLTARKALVSDGASSVYSIPRDFPDQFLSQDRYDTASHYNSMAGSKAPSWQTKHEAVRYSIAHSVLPHTLRFSRLVASELPNDAQVSSMVPSEYLHRHASRAGDSSSTVVADDSISMVLGRMEYRKHAQILRGTVHKQLPGAERQKN